MKFYIKLFIVLSAICSASAQDFNKAGTVGYTFLKIPVSARYMGLGETGITLTDAQADGVFINPALIALSDQTYSLNVSYAEWYVETSHQAAALTMKLPQMGTIGIQAVYFNFGEMEKTRNPMPTEFGSYVSLGTFSAGGLALGLSYANKLTPQFAFGANLKYVREFIDVHNSANVIADIGFLYFTGFRSLRIGASLLNFGLEAKYIDEKFKMPQLLKLGLSAEVWGDRNDANYITLLLEAAHPNDVNEHIQFGVENVWLNTLVLRGGYKLGHDDENLALGLGLRFVNRGMNFKLDMAYMKHERLDSTLRYTLAMEF